MRIFCWRWHRNCVLLLIILMLALLLYFSVLCNTSYQKFGQEMSVKTAIKGDYNKIIERNLHREPPDADSPLLPFPDDSYHANSNHTQLLQPSVPGQATSPKPLQFHSSQHSQRQSQQVHCKQPHCKEFLSRLDRVRYSSCLQVVLRSNRGIDPAEVKSRILENNCRFMEAKGRSPVALASAEGSGNTWIRGLLEKASGICTGFNYCDYVMRMKGFVGENINSGSVLVVKTHTDHPQWTGTDSSFNKFEARYGSGIFLVRNPYDSLVAEWNRRLTNQVMIKQKMPHNESHTNVAPKEIWYSEEWDKSLQSYMQAWKKRIQNWVLEKQMDHAVLIVRYEDLKSNTVKEVERMLTFLQYPFNAEDIPSRLAQDFTTFKRPHDVDFEHYTSSQKLYIESVLLQTIKHAQDSNMTHVLNLEEYSNSL